MVQSTIETNEQILFNRPNSLIICRIIKITDKAVQIDYAVEPISFTNNNCIVYNYSCYIPKSVIINDKMGGLTVKLWYSYKWEGGHRIKPYFLKDNNNKVFL
jgi:hypothetical protein